jgi:hypothetical protein
LSFRRGFVDSQRQRVEDGYTSTKEHAMQTDTDLNSPSTAQTRNTTDGVKNGRSIEARARRRVARKMGFYIHALVFVLVNAGLFAINAVTGEPRWAQFPLMGWGVGLAIHGIVTFIALQGDGVHQSMLDREIEYLRRNAG